MPESMKRKVSEGKERSLRPCVFSTLPFLPVEEESHSVFCFAMFVEPLRRANPRVFRFLPFGRKGDSRRREFSTISLLRYDACVYLRESTLRRDDQRGASYPPAD